MSTTQQIIPRTIDNQSLTTLIEEVIDSTTFTTGSFGNGTVALPSITFTSDTDTGIYRTTTNALGITAGGSLASTFTSSSITNAVKGLYPDGTVALPSISFTNDTNTGIYSIVADTLGITAGGVVTTEFASDHITSFRVINTPSGTVTSPAIRFNSDQDTGIYQSGGANSVGITCGGVLNSTFNTTGLTMNNLVINGAVGTSLLPSIYMTDSTSGLYRPASNQIGFTCSANKTLILSSGAVTIQTGTNLVQSTAGSAGAPSIYFSTDTTTGLYRPSANKVGFAVSGNAVSTFDSTGLIMESGQKFTPQSKVVTQATSNTTGVSSSGQSVKIQMFGTIAASTGYRFTLTNSFITSTSQMIGGCSQQTADAGFYCLVSCNVMSAGTCEVHIQNLSAVASTNAVYCVVHIVGET